MVTFVLFLVSAAVIAAVGIRLLGIDGDYYLVVVLAGTPLLAAGGLVVALFSLLLRRWAIATVLLAFTACLVAAVAPRAFSAARPVGIGPAVRVLSVDLAQGHADADAVVRLIRAEHVDVVSLQELTPQAVTALDAAGLGSELPERVFQPGDGPTGSGIASRYPLQSSALSGPSSFLQVSAVVSLPMGRSIEVLAVQLPAPIDNASTDTWKREMAGLPDPAVQGPARVLAGDFNATTDHAGLRREISVGYVDAAGQTGAGLVPTWPANRQWPPLLALDHVLVDHRCPVDSFDTYTIPGADHRAILAQFVASVTS